MEYREKTSVVSPRYSVPQERTILQDLRSRSLSPRCPIFWCRDSTSGLAIVRARVFSLFTPSQLFSHSLADPVASGYPDHIGTARKSRAVSLLPRNCRTSNACARGKGGNLQTSDCADRVFSQSRKKNPSRRGPRLLWRERWYYGPHQRMVTDPLAPTGHMPQSNINVEHGQRHIAGRYAARSGFSGAGSWWQRPSHAQAYVR